MWGLRPHTPPDLRRTRAGIECAPGHRIAMHWHAQIKDAWDDSRSPRRGESRSTEGTRGWEITVRGGWGP